MQAIKLILVCLVAVGLPACMSFTPVHFEFKLSTCPPAGFQMPGKVVTDAWEARAYKANECDGFTTYSFWEAKQSIYRGRKGDGKIFARVSPSDGSCRLHVGIAYPKLCGDSPPSKCEAFNNTQATAEAFSKTILSGQNFSASTPASKVEILQSREAFDKWCHSQ